MTDHEVVAQAGLTGEPLGCHIAFTNVIGVLGGYGKLEQIKGKGFSW